MTQPNFGPARLGCAQAFFFLQGLLVLAKLFGLCKMLSVKPRKLKARLYLLVAWVSLILGIIGIPTPLLPTTPFLLLAAFCFARGSQQWHDWLINHRVLGAYIVAFRDQKGITSKQKWRIAISILITLAVTGYFTPLLIGRIVIVVMGAFWLAWLYRYPTASPDSGTQTSALEENLDKTERTQLTPSDI